MRNGFLDNDGCELTDREKRLLHSLHSESIGRAERFHMRGELNGITNVGDTSFARLVDLKLIETGTASRHDEGTGYRITQDGIRCLYGKTAEQIYADGEKGIQTTVRKRLTWPLQE